MEALVGRKQQGRDQQGGGTGKRVEVGRVGWVEGGVPYGVEWWKRRWVRLAAADCAGASKQRGRAAWVPRETHC